MMPDAGRAAPAWAKAFLVALLLAPAALAWHSAREKSWTWDEPIYLAGGHYLYHTRNLRNQALSFHPPLAMYCNSLGLLRFGLDKSLFPAVTADYDREVGMQVAYRSGHDPRAIRTWARAPFIALIPLMGLLVYLWSRKLWGWRGGLLSAWLVAWNPNLLAHARLVATDYLFALLLVATLWCARGLLQRGGAGRLASTGLCAGLTLLAKFSAVVLGPMALLGVWFAGRMAVRGPWRSWAAPRVVGGAFIVAVVAFGVLWCGYLGEYGVALTSPDERAAVAAMPAPDGAIARVMHAVYQRDVRLPAMTYVMGVFSQFAHGSGGHSNYLLGQVSGRGWWYYFPVAILAKTPVPELLLWGGGAVAWFGLRRDPRELVWLVLAPVALVLLSMRANINIGLRHVLPVYPVGAILAGAVMRRWRYEPVRWLWWACAGGLLFTTLRIHPHYLTYFNSLSGGPARGHAILVDSNLDWGQDLDALYARARQEGWQPMHVQYFGPPGSLTFAPAGVHAADAPCRPVTGYFAVSVTNRVGAYMPGGAECFAWLDGYEPIARINNTIWVYALPPIPECDGPA